MGHNSGNLRAVGIPPTDTEVINPPGKRHAACHRENSNDRPLIGMSERKN